MGRILLLAILGLCFVADLPARDDAAWLALARENAVNGFMTDSDESEEDGVYCLMLTEIPDLPNKSAEVVLNETILEVKKNMTAYVKGETMSASSKLDMRSVTQTVNGEEQKSSFKSLEKKIHSKVNALVKCIKIVGQVSANDKSFVVCLTCERFEDMTAKLEAAQAQYGEEGVVSSVGEASNREQAVQKAIRGAVEQVLGTVVIGYDKAGNTEDFASKVFSGADGVVEQYRVLGESENSVGTRVELVAKVSKKNLLDNYTNYMKFLGDPAFYVQCDSPELASHFSDFFMDLGIRIATTPEEAKYIIYCTGTFRGVKHPIQQDKQGVQLSLRFQVMEATGGESLIDMTNDPRKSACFVGNNPERQMEICADKAFKQMKKPLHERIQKMVGKLVGRKMEEAAAGAAGED